MNVPGGPPPGAMTSGKSVHVKRSLIWGASTPVEPTLSVGQMPIFPAANGLPYSPANSLASPTPGDVLRSKTLSIRYDHASQRFRLIEHGLRQPVVKRLLQSVRVHLRHVLARRNRPAPTCRRSRSRGRSSARPTGSSRPTSTSSSLSGSRTSALSATRYVGQKPADRQAQRAGQTDDLSLQVRLRPRVVKATLARKAVRA